MRQLAVLMVLALATDAAANGRPAATSTINFRAGNDQHIAAGMTFGLVISHDGGATWHWMCEDAIKYSGMYDPDYVYTSTGSLFATTFNGLLVNRDGCSFNNGVTAMNFASTISRGPDNALYVGMVQVDDPQTSTVADYKIYKSTDDGLSFPTSSAPAADGIWWLSIEAAPSNASRVYASGYRLVSGQRQHEMYRSNNGGTSFTSMPTTGITLTNDSDIYIVGVSPLDPDHIYLRVTFQNQLAISDAIYRSTNGGTSWTKILERPAQLTFLVRANGDLVVGTKEAELVVSRTPSNGDAWETIAGAPHINCLVENTAGEVWACTQNFGAPGVPSDNAGIMKSTNLTAWTPVLRYQDIAGPVECAAGTLQQDKCVTGPPSVWCGLRSQFGIPADPTMCPAATDGPPGGDGVFVNPPPKGCCDNSASNGTAGLAMGALVGMVMLRRRRRG